MFESPPNSVKNQLYVIIMVVLGFQESLNIVTDSQCSERVVLQIETAELTQGDSKLTSLLIQLQRVIRNRSYPLHITHIQSHVYQASSTR